MSQQQQQTLSQEFSLCSIKPKLLHGLGKHNINIIHVLPSLTISVRAASYTGIKYNGEEVHLLKSESEAESKQRDCWNVLMEKKTAEFSFTDVNRLWADPPQTHTHTKIIISLSFYHFPLLVISLCHLRVTLCREAQIWKHQIQRVWTESSACFFFIYASNVNYQWTAEGQNLLSLQLWHIWIWTTIHINAVLNALCVCFLPEKTFEATTSWTNRHNLVAVAASVPVQNTLLHLFWPER